MKSRPDFLPPKALLLAGDVMAMNETKHPGNPWKTIPTEEHVAAALRHIYGHLDGERDPETGMSHLVHACCRVLMAVSREVDAERDHQQAADEHLEVLEPLRRDEAPPAASDGPPDVVYMNPRWVEEVAREPWWTPQDQDQQWIDSFDEAHFRPLAPQPDRASFANIRPYSFYPAERGIDDFLPIDWDKAALNTKPLWSHHTPSGDTTRIDYEAALRQSHRDSE